MSRRLLVLALVLVAIAPFVPLLVNGEVPILRDHRDYFVPLRHFTALELSEGRVPLWNPYNGSGEPWLANPQTAIFYPPAYLFVVFPFAFAYVAYLALHVALLAVGSFFLFVRRSTPAAAALGAVAVALSGPVFAMLDVGNNLTTFAWIPATLACALARRDAEPRSPRAVLAVMLALLFLGGEPFLAAIGWVAVAVALLAGRFRRGAFDAAVTLVIALLLSAAQLLPFLAMLRGSDRASGLGADALANSLAPSDWLAVLIHPGGGEYSAIFASQQFIVSLYVGALVVALAALAFFGVSRNGPRRIGIAVAVSVIAGVALFAAGSHLPGSEQWWPALGLDVVRFPSRLVPFAVLALGYLAAVGADALGDADRRARVLAASFVVAMTGVALFAFSAPTEVVLFTVTGAAAAGIVVAIGPAVATERRVFLLALLVALDLAFAARGLLVGAPLRSYAPRVRTTLAAGERFARLPDAEPSGYTNLIVGIADISTSAPVIDRTYSTIHDAALFEPRTDILNFLSVRALLTHRDIRHPSFTVVDRKPRVLDDATYRNRDALPPAALWNSWLIGSSRAEAVTALLSGQVVADRRPIVVGDDIPAPSDPTIDNPGTAKLLGLDTQRAIVDVNANHPALLTLNQNDADGWKVSIDGKQANPLSVNGNFRGVMVAQGAHRVVWTYTPPLLRAGIALGIAGLALILGDAIALRRRRARG
jgi:hypothetical protein